MFEDGDLDDYMSASEGDLALAGMIAFWAGPDPETIERLMRRSKCHRPKWDDHPDYLFRTITKALSGRTEFYKWPVSTGTAQSALAPHEVTPNYIAGIIAPHSDLANSKLLAQKFGSGIRFTEESGWMIHDGARFIRDAEAVRIMAIAKETASQLYAEIQNSADRDAASKHAKQSQNRRALESMVALARSEPGILIPLSSFDADPWLINLRNGTLDLRTRQLHPHSPASLISKLAGTEYIPGATALRWEAFISRVMADDESLINYLRRLTGYLLTGLSNEQVLHFFFGEGANGKSVYVEVLLRLLADYGNPMPSDLLMTRMAGSIPNDIAALRGQRAVFLNETTQGASFDEAKLKELSGGDTLSARFLNREYFSFKPTHKLVIRGNHKPRISGSDEGIWRRLRLVPFKVTIPPEERDPQLLEKLTEELPGVLNWALEGLQDWIRSGLNPPDSVLAAGREYRDESDTLGQFLEERCERGQAATIPASEILEAYVAFCKSRQERPIPVKDLPGEMAKRGFLQRRTNKARLYLGLQLRVDPALSDIVNSIGSQSPLMSD
jgi:putative DNA primase/helicase